MRAIAAFVLAGALALTSGCGTRRDAAAPQEARIASAASVIPSQESSTQFLVGLATTMGAEATTRVAMSSTPQTTYRFGDDATMTIGEALTILPRGQRSTHESVIWWGSTSCEITYHRAAEGYVLDSVWASVPH